MSGRSHPGFVTRATILALGIAVLAGCGFHAPTPEILERVRQVTPPGGPFLRRQFEAAINTRALNGVYQGVLVVEPGPTPRVRMQLFPDIGPKVLDLAAGNGRIHARLSGEDELRVEIEPEKLEPRLLTLFAITLLEDFTPLDPVRVIGYRVRDGRTELRLSPHASGVKPTIVLDESNRVIERQFSYGWVCWHEVTGPPYRLTARGLEFEVESGQEDVLERVPDALFGLPEKP